jgi:hypothetical protein
MVARFWNALRREPLVHFLVLAALLFVTYDLLMPSEQEPLVIERASIDELVAQQATLLGRPLTDDERTVFVEPAIDDAVLLREAYKRGLDQDAVVRRHLVQKMRFVLGEGGARADRGGAQGMAEGQSRALPQPADSDARARVLR